MALTVRLEVVPAVSRNPVFNLWKSERSQINLNQIFAKRAEVFLEEMSGAERSSTKPLYIGTVNDTSVHPQRAVALTLASSCTSELGVNNSRSNQPDGLGGRASPSPSHLCA